MAEFRMPALGADMEAGVLVAWRRKPGDVLQRGDVIAEVETDKGVIEVEVFSPGVLERYLVEAGQKVPVGTPLAVLSEPTPISAPQPIAASPAPAAAPQPTALQPTAAKPSAPLPPSAHEPLPPPPTDQPSPVAAPPSVRRLARELGVDLGEALARARRVSLADVNAQAGRGARSSPAARRRAHELGVDLHQLQGTGPDAAIVLADVERAARRGGERAQPRAAQAEPSAPASQPTAAQTERGPDSARRALRRAIGAAMARSKREIPHYYLTQTIDLHRAITWLDAHNREHGVKERILPGALLLKAVALAAKQLPDFNTLFTDATPHSMPDVHLGVAIALRGGGLVAPAILRAHTLALPELMAKLQDLVTRARAGLLRSSELSDGTITVTSLGERGVEGVLPIIYPPQTAIVGFGRISERPWVADSALVVRPLVTASLGADHRVTDGHLGARFLNLIDELLQTPERL